MNTLQHTGRATHADIERQTQIEEMRRLGEGRQGEGIRRTLSLSPSGNTNYNGQARRPQSPKGKPAGKPVVGHEAFLRALSHSGANVVLEKISSGNTYQGQLKHSDAYTVTMLVTSVKHNNNDVFESVPPFERVIYKHDISEFYTTTARPAEARA
jgi:hypothetical protein